MVQLPNLQPLDDVNKRASRMAANIPFIRANLSPLSFTDLPRGLTSVSLFVASPAIPVEVGGVWR
jgi:hypothetical protein